MPQDDPCIQNTNNLKAEFLDALRHSVISEDTEFHFNETQISDLWPASDEEKKQNDRKIIYSWDDFARWLQENDLYLTLAPANTRENLAGTNRHRRDMTLRKT